MNLLLHPLAEKDVASAAEFYKKSSSSVLAAKFVSEFRRMTQLIFDFPQIGSTRSRGRRSLAMTLFPYSVIYQVQQETILILVVKHNARRPSYGASRV